jgi:hypothetical protein
MGSMRHPRVVARILRLALAAFLVGAPAAESRAADPAARSEFVGSCYCRSEGRLSCTAELTLGECRRRCDEQLCDDWYWKERLPCWNWGYGG